MRLRLALSGLGLSVFLASGALEARPRLQGVGAGSLGYTDNVQSSPDPPVEGVPERQAGAFALVSPGVVLADSRPGNGTTFRMKLPAEDRE